MGLAIVVVTLILAIIIIIYELIRGRSGIKGKIDFMRMVSIVYFIAFVVDPLYIQITNLSGFQNTSDDWIVNNNFNDSIFLDSSILALIGYVLIIFGYRFANVFSYKHGEKQTVHLRVPSNRYLFNIATLLGIIGFATFYMYMKQSGGFWTMIKYSGALRSTVIDVSNTAFLRNIAPLALSASYFYYGLLYKTSKTLNKIVVAILFVFILFLSILILFNQAGRLNLVSYLSLFLLVKMIKDNKIRLVVVIPVIALVCFALLYGKALFNIFLDPGAIQSTTAKIDSTSSVGSILLEFSFPYITLANAVKYVPTNIDYRWFIDIFIGFANLVPKRIFPIQIPESVSDVNTSLYSTTGQIPVDLLSFGYYSAGVFGILLVTICFGISLFLFDKLVPLNNEPVFMIFRGAWMLFLATRIMYGDPTITTKVGFYLFVGTIFLLIPSFFRSRNLKFSKDTKKQSIINEKLVNK